MKSEPPIKDLLESPTEEAQISSMWMRIRERRSFPKRSNRPWVAGGVAITAAAAAAMFLLRAPAEEPRVVTAIHLETSDTLDLADGTQTPDAIETSVSLADGSSIDLDDGGRIELIQNSPDRIAMLLARGRARFSVTPGGERQWVIESGLATVEVIGTVFTVHRSDEGVRVNVERGLVVVRGERVPERVARLGAGDELFVPNDVPDHAVIDPIAVADPEPVAVEPRERPRRIQRASTRPRATVELGPPAAAPPVDTPREERALDEMVDSEDDLTLAQDPRAALAAFTLGRMEMDELHRPARAREAFRRALALGLPTRLAAQARRRLEQLE